MARQHPVSASTGRGVTVSTPEARDSYPISKQETSTGQIYIPLSSTSFGLIFFTVWVRVLRPAAIVFASHTVFDIPPSAQMRAFRSSSSATGHSVMVRIGSGSMCGGGRGIRGRGRRRSRPGQDVVASRRERNAAAGERRRFGGANACAVDFGSTGQEPVARKRIGGSRDGGDDDMYPGFEYPSIIVTLLDMGGETNRRFK